MAYDIPIHPTKIMIRNLFNIRPATADDVETIIGFNAALALETEQRRLDLDRLREGTRALLAHHQYGYYIMAETSIEEGRTAVGQLMITYEWSDWRNGVFWWIQSVYVTSAWRSRGVYRAMHTYVTEKATADPKVCGIRLYVEQNNHDAQTVYHKVGLRSSCYTIYEQDFVLGHTGSEK